MSCGPHLLGTALWVGAWLQGAAAPDDVIDSLGRLLPDAPAAPLLPAIRQTGAGACWLLLPRPGRTLGWPHDLADTPQPALLLYRGDAPVGLVRAGTAGWRVDPVHEAPVLSLQAEALPPRAAGRVLSAVLLAAAADLEGLDLARPPDDAMPTRWRRALSPGPSLPDDAADVLARATLVLDGLDAALASSGAAVTAGEVRARDGVLREVQGQVEDVVAALVGGLFAVPVR